MSFSIKRYVPNFITSLNLFSGCLSIVLAFEGYLLLAVYMIFLSAVFDFFDGMSARLLKVYSEAGKQLDSLADVVSFGVAPSVIVFSMMKIMLFGSVYLPSLENIPLTTGLFLISPFLIAVFSGLRLAKFNVDTRQNESFIGLPTPANALFFVSLYIITLVSDNTLVIHLIQDKVFLLVLIIVFSLLLIAEFPMFSLKFKSLGLAGNKIRFIFIGLSAVLLILLHSIAVPVIIILYIVLSAINNWIYNLD
ncbi:MAG: CDP-alcohol phosphatidyltransferase family protein [Bacteroidales bacterium]|jgi:CDP-diacylglycerol--serine O-phosphatidyltransferase|nr:CDP-alcohol phosphatidyltransferase family protein [Bacteroidales bacterium]